MRAVLLMYAIVYLLLEAAVIVETQRAANCSPCVPRRCENETLVQESCPDSKLVNDPCGCCKICGSRFGEPCGGAYGHVGTCEYGELICTADLERYLTGEDISGVCTRKVCTKNCTSRRERRLCGDDGRWYRNICALRKSKFCNGTGVEPASAQTCDRACPDIQPPANGSVSYSKGIVQTSVANITCTPPYSLVSGDQYRTCIQGGRGAAWNGSHPLCRHPCELHICSANQLCELNQNGEPQCVCGSLVQCSGQTPPVCASNSNTYTNRCEFQVEMCRNSTPEVYIINNGRCSPN